MTNITRRNAFQWVSVAISTLGLMVFPRKAEGIIDRPGDQSAEGRLAVPERIACPGTWTVTRWSPVTTCECVLDYGVNRDDPDDNKVLIPLPPVSVCPKHRGAADPFMAAVFDNRRASGWPEEKLAKGFDLHADPSLVAALVLSRDAADRVNRFQAFVAQQRKRRELEAQREFVLAFNAEDLKHTRNA